MVLFICLRSLLLSIIESVVKMDYQSEKQRLSKSNRLRSLRTLTLQNFRKSVVTRVSTGKSIRKNAL